MNKKTVRTAGIMAALMCITSVASCGKDVQRAEDFDVTGGFSIAENTVPENEEQQATEEVTSETTTSEISGTTTSTSVSGTGSLTTSTASFVLGTRKTGATNPPATKTAAANPTATKATAAVTIPAASTAANVPVVSASQTTAVTDAPAQTTTAAAKKINLSYYSAEVAAGQTIKYPVVSETITEIWTSSDENVATVDKDGNITGIGEGICTIKVTSADDSTMSAEVKVTVKSTNQSGQQNQTGIQQENGLTYVNGILIANKTYSLPSDYNPGGLTDDTYSAFQELVSGAANDGINIYLSSGFRSYDYQDQIYNNYVYYYGQTTADTFSARPGHSEHQTGMAIDVNTIDDTFIGTPEAIWLENHCTEYGFIIRYPQGKQEITGYKYEPWHIRYVGKEVAQAVKDAAAAVGDPYLTLEEYLGIDSYYH